MVLQNLSKSSNPKGKYQKFKNTDMKKLEKKDLQSTYGQPTMKIFKSKSNREFRLAGCEKTENGYFYTIFWFDTEKYETIIDTKIEPYLI